MKQIIFLSLLFLPSFAMAIEEPKHMVVKKEKEFELRQYAPYIVAETMVAMQDYEDASNEGFRLLAGYIFGGNTRKQKMEMTSPVTTETSQKIAMTAPVQSEKR